MLLDLIVAVPQPLREDDVFMVVQLVISLVFAVVCAAMAPGRGRSAVGWFFIGLLFNCVALIILLLIPNLKIEEDRQRRQRAETRKLREQPKKERWVADERQQGYGQRLAAHDRAPGVDTAPAELPGELPGEVPPPVPLPSGGATARTWFFAVDGDRRGPVSGAELRALWLDQKVPDSTIVWSDGMGDWQSIAEVGDMLGDER